MAALREAEWRSAVGGAGGILLALGIVLAGISPASARTPSDPIPLEAFTARGPWRLGDLSIEGLGPIEVFLLEPRLDSRPRPIWTPWRERPRFSVPRLEGDLALIRRDREAAGYYDAHVRAEIVVRQEPSESGGASSVEPGVVDVRIVVAAGGPARVCSLWVEFGGAILPETEEAALLARLPMRSGEPFAEAPYRSAAGTLARYFRDAGHPRATVERRARVLAKEGCVQVAYSVSPGVTGVFGPVEIVGLADVDADIVRHEIAFVEGQRWDERLLDETADRLRGLGIFGRVRVVALEPQPDGVVPVRIELAEGAAREVRVGFGYGTNEGVRGTLSWSSYNFLGGARKLTLTARLSQITRAVDVGLVQPHFPASDDTGQLHLQLGRQDESTYIDDFAQIVPRLDFDLGDGWAANTFLGFGYDSLSGVSESTKEALGPLSSFQNAGFTDRVGFGLGWTWTDPGDVGRGVTLGFSSELATPWLASDFSWVSFVAQAGGYHRIAGDLSAAVRVRAGSVVPLGTTPQIPLWSRFYAGGITSFPVRGYARRRVGPMSPSNDPLGGRSVVVGSVELSYPIFGPVRLVTFLDAGDVELPAWTLRLSDIQKGTGVGLRAETPVGPVQFDLGFGLDRVAGDGLVQVTFSIGDPWG